MIEIVSEKTGYPADVLDLDMQLDADLGIDSIKRVEILSALQDRLPSLPSISPELLGTLRTLRSIVEQIGGARSAEDEQAARSERAACAVDSASSHEIARELLETVADKTGYPVEMLELDMRLDTDLGIDSIKRVEIFSAIQDKLPGVRAAGPEEIGTLGTLREIVSFLGRSTGISSEPEIQPKVTADSGLAGSSADRPAYCSNRSRRRRASRSICWISTCSSTSTWALTRSSESRSSRPCRIDCRTRERSAPSKSVRCGRFARSQISVEAD